MMDRHVMLERASDSARILGPADHRRWRHRARLRHRLRLARVPHPRLSVREGKVVWAVREEMAITVDDVLSRRSRALILDARAAVEMAPRVAELGRSQAWQRQQVESFRALAGRYLP